MDKNYYDILGVSINATSDEIRKQYRKLAKKLHPDMGVENDIFFKLVNEAYETLINDEKRLAYDRKIRNNSTDYNKQYSDFNNNYYGDYKKTDKSTTNNYSNTYTFQQNNNYEYSKNSTENKKTYDISNLKGLKKLLFLIAFYLNKIISWSFIGIFMLIGGIAYLAMKIIATILGLFAIVIFISLFTNTYIPWLSFIIASTILGLIYFLCDNNDVIFGLIIKFLDGILEKLYIFLSK